MPIACSIRAVALGALGTQGGLPSLECPVEATALSSTLALGHSLVTRPFNAGRVFGLDTGGGECGADANTAKLLASEAGWHAAEATMSTYGGFAFAREYDIERKWREIRLYKPPRSRPT